MSLRARLALLYTSIVGGILLLFGMAVYMSVSTSLIRQLDDRLISSANNVVSTLRSGALGDISMPELDLFTDIYIQVWSREGKLESRSQNIQGLYEPLDSGAMKTSRPVFRDIQLGNNRLRVLTVPIAVAGTERLIGRIQLGTPLIALETTQMVLVNVLLIGAGLSMYVAGIVGWYSINRALTPLEAVTETALQITRADDLSRRIPYNGPNDEVGQLIAAFNETLSRLENLFNTQKRFVADVGHELRTPLTVIRGNVDLMRRMRSMDEESMDSIISEVNRLARMVDDLLLLAQAESGKLPLIKKTFEMDSLVLEVLSQMNIVAKGRIRLKLGEIDQVLIFGDRDRLKQVLLNLVGNAINYTPAGGDVVVGLAKEGSRARITVSDSGTGISPEDLPFIFERFYRGEKSRTRGKDGKGYGLGLSIAYWIVRNHEGLIEVSSQLGSGTTFCVWLPLTEEKPGSQK